MPKNVVITPLSGLVDFYDLNSNLDAKIQVDDAGSLNITNTGGTLTLGNTAANVYIGDGTNSVDVIFEQNGAIRALTGKTLTLGNSASNVTVQSPLTVNSPILNTTTTGYFEVRQTVSTWTNSTSHPIIKWDYNATYDDHLYLASGGNAAGTSQTALVIGETNISIGKANATPNASSVLSTTSVTINASTGGIATTGVIISSGTGYRIATGTDAGGNLNLGRIDNVASTPFIDFNCGATTVDHDVRLAATGGNGSNGGGLLTVTGNLSLTGNLTVNGTTTTVNSTTVTIDDPIFTLGGDTAPTVDDNKDRGIEFRWHNGTVAKVGFFGYDDSTGYLTFIPDATNTSEVFSGTQGDIQATNFRGNLVGNASTATTWQTARTITVGNTGKSVDGSAAVSWTLAEIGAYAATNPSGYITSSASITGSAGNVTGTVAIGNGGTGATTAAAALTALGAYAATNPSGYTSNTGTVTSVGGTGTVSGLTLSGTVTSTGNLTLGGTLNVATSDTINVTVADTGRVFQSKNSSAANAVQFYIDHSLANINIGNSRGTVNFNAGTLQYAGNQVLSAGNYTSYSPTLTGTGASGTWAINISGTAAAASSVAWTNVSGRPTAVSSFTNDSGYITSSGSVLINGASQISGSNSALCVQYSGAGTQYGITIRPSADSTTVMNIMNAAGTSVGSITQTSTGVTFNGTIAWTNVSGRPTAVSSFTNDSGYITSSGSITGSAGSVAWTNVSGRPTAVSSFTNDSGYITSSGSISGNAATATTAANTTGVAGYSISWGYVAGAPYYIWGTNGASGVTRVYAASEVIVGSATNATNATNATYSTYAGSSTLWATNGQDLYGRSKRVAVASVGNVIYNYGGDFSNAEIQSALLVSGNVTAYASDRRLKTNIVPITNALERINKLSGFTFNWNGTAKSLAKYNSEVTEVGVFAQDVQQVQPEAVKAAPFDTHHETGLSISGENYLTVQYDKLVPLLVEAVKECSNYLEQQEARINQLESLVKALVTKE